MFISISTWVFSLYVRFFPSVQVLLISLWFLLYKPNHVPFPVQEPMSCSVGYPDRRQSFASRLRLQNTDRETGYD